MRGCYVKFPLNFRECFRVKLKHKNISVGASMFPPLTKQNKFKGNIKQFVDDIIWEMDYEIETMSNWSPGYPHDTPPDRNSKAHNDDRREMHKHMVDAMKACGCTEHR